MRAILTKRFVRAAIAIGIAASLGGCASRPFSYEEKIWFDKAVGHDLLPSSPGLVHPNVVEFSPYAPPPDYVR